MRVLLISDEESDYIWDHFDRARFAGVELILSCGDLKRAYLEYLVSMIPAPLFYVPGNHDKGFVREPPEGCVSVDGRIETYKGLRILGFGGCRSQRLAAYEYTDEVMTKRVRAARRALKQASGADILLTHAPALGVGDGDAFHAGFSAFLPLQEMVRYHFYGHQHTSYGRGPGEFRRGDTLVKNACGYHLLDIEG